MDEPTTDPRLTPLEAKRARCEHDYGNMCEATFLGCVRTCVKCGQKKGLGRSCTSAAKVAP